MNGLVRNILEIFPRAPKNLPSSRIISEKKYLRELERIPKNSHQSFKSISSSSIECIFIGLFKNDLAAEWNKLDKNTQRSAQVDNSNFDPAVSLADHNGKTWPASQLIERLKTLIGNIIRDPAKLSADQVVDMLGRSEETLLNRYDVTAAAFKCLLQLTFDFVFIICMHLPIFLASSCCHLASFSILLVFIWRRFLEIIWDSLRLFEIP